MLANICFSWATSPLSLLIFLTFGLNALSAYNNDTQYKTVYIENPDLCSSVAVRKETLYKRNKPGLIVRQLRLNLHTIAWEKNSVCKFKVEADTRGFVLPLFGVPSHETGVLAVIEDLVFRRNETTNQCIDYVQFRLSNGHATEKFCGLITTGFSLDGRFQDAYLDNMWGMGLGAVKSKGAVEVIIFIDKEPLQEDENMELVLVFTLYTDCSHDHDKTMRPCSDQQPTTCIPKQFFNDTIVNCPFIDCVDEGGCGAGNHGISIQQATDHLVIACSMGVVCIVFGVFALLVWCCKKHKVMCWAETFAHPNRTQTRVMEMHEGVGVNVVASAPPPTMPLPEEDKPPSYESLFPSR